MQKFFRITILKNKLKVFTISFLSFLTFTRTNAKTFFDAFVKICLAENGNILYEIVFCKVNFKHKTTNFLILDDATILVCSLELCVSESNYKKGKNDKISQILSIL